jgi:O-antigen ligase
MVLQTSNNTNLAKISSTSKFEKFLEICIFTHFIVLALGLLTSTSLLALSHIFMIIPAIYFLKFTDIRKIPISTYCLLAIFISIVLSVIMNMDIAVKGIRPIFKAKYFLIALLSIAPYQWYFKNQMTAKKVKILLTVFMVSTTIASLNGLIDVVSGYNLVLRTFDAPNGRNAGTFGMTMNYAHNMSFFLIIFFSIGRNRKYFFEKIQLSRWLLSLTIVVNTVGLYFSFTRGAILALLFGVSFYYVKTNIKVLLSTILIGVILLAGIFIYKKDVLIRPQSNSERISQWKAAVYAFQERPLFGYGYLNFEEHSSLLKKKYHVESENFKGHAHNNFFEMLGATGIFGIISFLGFVCFWFLEAWKVKSKDRYKNITALTSIGFLVVFIVGGLTQSTIALGINLFFVMSFYAIVTAMLSNSIASDR